MSQEALVNFSMLATVVFLLVTALFTIARGALVAERNDRVEQKIAAGLDKADSVTQTIRELKSLLATAEMGILIGLLGLGWNTSRVVSSFSSLQSAYSPFIILISFLVSACIYTALAVILPRSSAASATKGRLTGASVKWTALCQPLLSPVVKGAELLAQLLLRLTGRYHQDDLQGVYANGDLAALSLRSHRYGVLGAAQREILSTLFNFRERRARDVLTAQSEMACVYGSMRVSEALEVVRQFGFTRYPVCDGVKDRVIGTIHYRDLVDAADANPRQFVTDVMDTALMLSEKLPVSEVLKEMHARRAHIAIILNDHDTVQGLLTTDDILREIYGEQEPKTDAPKLQTLSHGTIEFDGTLIVEEVEDALGVELGHAGLETIGSFVFGRLGRKAQEGDTLKVQGVLFDVLQMKGARITRLRAQRTRELPPDM